MSNPKDPPHVIVAVSIDADGVYWKCSCGNERTDAAGTWTGDNPCPDK